MKRKWNKVYFDGYFLHSRNLPRDGAWMVWKNGLGQIEVCRLKYDIFEYFHPNPKYLVPTRIMYWRLTRDGRGENDQRM